MNIVKEENATYEEIESVVNMYRALPREERVLITNSTFTLYMRQLNALASKKDLVV